MSFADEDGKEGKEQTRDEGGRGRSEPCITRKKRKDYVILERILEAVGRKGDAGQRNTHNKGGLTRGEGGCTGPIINLGGLIILN